LDRVDTCPGTGIQNDPVRVRFLTDGYGEEKTRGTVRDIVD
jgi:hypothetical protein